MAPLFYGRRRPYTEIGIRRMRCARCGRRAHRQWSICANGNRQVPVCARCDYELNVLVVVWFGFERGEEMLARYRATLADELVEAEAEAVTGGRR